MWIIIVIAVILLLLVIISIGLFLYIYYNPPRKHDNPDNYPHDKVNPVENELRRPLIDELRSMDYEDVEITSFDGLKLKGRFFVGNEGMPYALLMHGYKANPIYDFCGSANMLMHAGYNVLMIQERAGGYSEGSVISFGINERRDCLSWDEYLVNRFGNDIRIFNMGVSLGSATVLMALGLELPKNVKCVVADCGYTSPGEIIRYVSGLPKWCVGFFYALARFSARLLGRFDPDEASAIEAVKNTSIPVLFFHGEEDKFVPFQMGRELFSACASEKQFYSVPGAVHASSVSVDPDGYERTMLAFLNRYL